MAFERITNNIHKLNDSLRSYLEVSAEYYKLELFNKGMKGAIGLINGLISAFLIFFTLLFLSVAVSVWLSELIGAPSSGFFIVAGFYLLLFFCMLLFGGKLIQKTLLVKVSRKVFNEDEDNENQKEVENETV